MANSLAKVDPYLLVDRLASHILTFPKLQKSLQLERKRLLVKLELISNPLARKGQASAVFEKARQLFVDLGVEVEAHYPETPEASIATMKEIAHTRSGRVVVVGGDGMVGVAANCLTGTDTTLALIPAGRGNDFARSIGIPTDMTKAARIALGDANQIDTITATTEAGKLAGFDHGARRTGVTIATMGFSARVNRRAETSRLRLGVLQYTASTLLEMSHVKPIEIDISVDDGPVETKEILILALANTQYFGGGMRVAPNASVSDAKLDLVTIGGVSRATLISQLVPLRFGLHLHHPLVDITRVSKLRIDTPGFECRVDGDHYGMTPMEMAVNPKSLWVAGAKASTN